LKDRGRRAIDRPAAWAPGDAAASQQRSGREGQVDLRDLVVHDRRDLLDRRAVLRLAEREGDLLLGESRLLHQLLLPDSGRIGWPKSSRLFSLRLDQFSG